MKKVLSFTIETYQALQKYDCILNTETALKFADIWDKAYIKLMEAYRLPQIRLTGEGFDMGAATATECIDLARIIRKSTKKDVYFYSLSQYTLFEFLDDEFIKLMEPEVKALIEYYNEYCQPATVNKKLKTVN